jgi:biopolymer transport protein ExbB/TolQ/DNA-directed RNA polymerase subunit RPC12/RpoP
MYFSMDCKSCGKTLKVRDELVGRNARCPYCQAAVVVARPAAAPAGSAGGAGMPGGVAAPAPAASAVETVPANTDVSVFLHMVIGVALTGLFYLAIWPLSYRDGKITYLGRLFIGTATMEQGGWVPIAECLLFFWSVSMLVDKYLKIRRQKRGLLFDVLPAQIGEKIRQENLDRFVTHIRGLPQDAVGSFLVTRCLRGLEHFRVRRSAADTATMLASKSELDQAGVDASYTTFHVFIWAIPILGFLGTVIGMSAAVGGFTGTLESASDINALKEGLKSITSGLGTAFDTTLVALMMAMILTFPVSSLQKGEGDLLGQVDEYTSEYLLRRLEDGRGGPEQAGGASGSEMRQILADAFAAQREQLTGWTDQLKSIGSTIAIDVEKAWKTVDERQLERLRQTEQSLADFVNKLDGVGEHVGRQAGELWERASAKMVEEHARRAGDLESLTRLLESGRGALTGIAADADSARERAAKMMAGAAESVEKYSATMQTSLHRLAEVIEKLGGKPLQIEYVAPPQPAVQEVEALEPVEILAESPQRKSWWSFGGGGRTGRNGSTRR